MPKKTKKQKILAEQRQINQKSLTGYSFVNTQISHKIASDQSISKPDLSYSIKSNTKPQTEESLHDYSYVKHDLIRITIFTSFAVILQGVLYFVMKGH
jgi:hypothetical protein